MKTIKIEFSDERLITPSGLSLVGQVLGKSDLVSRCNKLMDKDKRSGPQIKTSDVLLTYIGLLCQSKTQYESVNEMLEDPEYYCLALGLSSDIPSAETLRQRMDSVGASLRNEILEANVSMLDRCKIEPTALDCGKVAVDLDVTPMDNSGTKKERVSFTYKKFDGYAPMMAYIGTEGFLVNTELREGKQHCQNHTPEFLRETLHLSHKLTSRPLLIRMDSGNDAATNLGILIEDGSWFIVKRNMRKSESKDEWLKLAKEVCKDIRHPRDGKDVYIGSSWKEVDYLDSNGNSKNNRPSSLRKNDYREEA